MDDVRILGYATIPIGADKAEFEGILYQSFQRLLLKRYPLFSTEKPDFGHEDALFRISFQREPGSYGTIP